MSDLSFPCSGLTNHTQDYLNYHPYTEHCCFHAEHYRPHALRKAYAGTGSYRSHAQRGNAALDALRQVLRSKTNTNPT